MTFRTSNKLQRYEMVKFSLDNIIEQPGNNNSQKKTGYKFTITDRSTFFDYFNGYFEYPKSFKRKLMEPVLQLLTEFR